jgi:hypothetical protein
MNDNSDYAEQEVEIHISESLRDTSKNSAQYSGSVPQEQMEQEGRFIIRPFKNVDRNIVAKFNECTRFDSFWSQRPSRGVYILGNNRENIVEGHTPFISDVPALQGYYLDSSGVKFIDLSNLSDSNIDSARETMNPRLLFKVLRGSDTVVHKDGTGRFASTGDLVNAEVSTEQTEHSLSTLHLLMNSSMVSYYMQQIVYSGSTETARNLDAPYIKNIPIPRITQTQSGILSRLSNHLMFTTQYTDDRSTSDKIIDASILFSRIADVLCTNLYMNTADVGQLWDALDQALTCKIDFEQWADKRFSTSSYPTETTDNYSQIINRAHSAVNTESIIESIETIETTSHHQRITDILSR